MQTRIDQAHRRLQSYLQGGESWGLTHAGPILARPVAYFSAEFGLHQSLPIYSGGLGVLAGDHLKSMSDLGAPVVGVGLLYHQGYVHQLIDESGWQQDLYEPISGAELPADPVTGTDRETGGEQLRFSVELPGRDVFLRLWRVNVGRSLLLLLDARDDANSPDDQALTARLYGGDQETRIQQEILLGVGGLPGPRHRGDQALRDPPERGALRLRPPRARPRIRGARRPGSRRRPARGGRHQRLHHPHPRRSRARPLPRRPREPPPGAPRPRPRPPARRGARPRLRASGRRQRHLLPHRAGPQAHPPRQRRLRPSRPGLAQDVASASTPARPRKRCPSATSPTASTCAPGSPPTCTTCFVQLPRAALARPHLPAADLWDQDRQGPRRRDLGGPPGAQGPPHRLRPRPPRRPAAPPRPARARRARRSTPRPSPSASPAASPPTSGPTSCSATSTGSTAW